MNKDSDNLWNHTLFVFQGIVYGLIIAWITASNYPTPFQSIHRVNNEFFNHDFFITFVAAAAGGAVLLLLDYLRQESRNLAEYNSSRSILAVHIVTLLDLKKQIAQPIASTLEKAKIAFEISLWCNLAGMKENGVPTQIVVGPGIYLRHFHLAPMEFLLPLENLARHCDEDPRTIMLAAKAKTALATLQNCAQVRDKLLDELKSLPNDEVRVHRIFGTPLFHSGGRVLDARFYETTMGFLTYLDHALFFLDRTLQSLDRSKTKIVAWWLRRKVKGILIQGKDYMPPDDLISGWKE